MTTTAGVMNALAPQIVDHQIMGAVTAIVSANTRSSAAPITIQLECIGHAAQDRPMAVDTVFRIASMSKPITGAAVLMLQDEGRLQLSDTVTKYIPELGALRTPAGDQASVTLLQMLTHTSGMGEGDLPVGASSLAELVPAWSAADMLFAPGERWSYCQSGINACCRVVEVVSGLPFDEFLQQRLFGPLGMVDTTFYPSAEQLTRLAAMYTRTEAGKLETAPEPSSAARGDKTPPLGNGGLFSTAPDYARFARMLLSGGRIDGVTYLSSGAVAQMSQPATPLDMPCGFMPGFGLNYGWGAGCCVLKKSHPGPGESILPGTFGHGGAWGTQCWIDPAAGAAYLLFVQRNNFGASTSDRPGLRQQNADNTPAHADFQAAAAKTVRLSNL